MIQAPGLLPRFWSKVQEDGSCWTWTGAVGSKGYGHFRACGVTLKAHRVAYEAMVGPIPTGLVLDHLCRNQLCVNPQHLDPVTDRVNIARGARSFSGQRAMEEECSAGHLFTEENTYRFGEGGLYRTCRECNREASRRRRARLRGV